MSVLPDAVLLLEKKLNETWSSPSVVALLEARPALLEETRTVFGNLNKIIKMRVLLALTAFEQISVLPIHQVSALLDEADSDKDEWVRVVSGQVREWLFPQESFQKQQFGEGGPTLSPPERASDDIIAKSELRLFDPKEKMVDPEPYFSPMEYLYLSEAIIQRHHVAAPLIRKKNPHFEVGSLKAMQMEAIPDQPPSLLPVIKPEGEISTRERPQLPTPSFPAPVSQSTGPASTPFEFSKSQISSSLLSKTVMAQRRPERATVKLIDADQTVTSTEESAKRDEEMRQELVTSYAADEATIAQSHKSRAAHSAGLAPGGDAKRRAIEVGSSGQAGFDHHYRSVSPGGMDASKSDIPSSNSSLQGHAMDTSSPPPSMASTSTGAEPGPLAEYEKLIQKASNLPPEDDKLLRDFYLYRADVNAPTMDRPPVKILLNEKIIQDGDKQVRESIFVSLDYQTRKPTLTKKTKKISEGQIPPSTG